MSELQKIIDLLDKETPTEEEKKYLSEKAGSDDEAAKIIKLYKQLKNVSASSHPDEELIGKYILYKNNDGNNKLFISLVPKIEEHLRKCSKCTDLFKYLTSEYYELNNFVDNRIPEKKPDKEDEKRVGFKTPSYVRYFVTAILVIGFLYLGTFTVTSMFTPDYKKSAFNFDDRVSVTRGRTTENFQRAVEAIENKNYSDAINYLEQDISQSSNNNSIFYSHYILGLTYLKKSESNTLGIINSYDNEEIEKGIEHLKQSISLNNSGSFDNINFDSHYFIGKAYLLLDDEMSAADHLKTVVENKGSYYKEAEELIRIINQD